jgi:hypothetical protein
MSATTFRDYDDGCSGLVWCANAHKWLCGGSLGVVYQLEKGNDKFESKTFNAGDSAVTALVVNEAINIVAHSNGDCVAIRALDDLDQVKEERAVRRTLSISHLQFTSTGKFL